MFLFYDLLVLIVVVTTILPWHCLLILSKRFTWENLQERLGTNHIPNRLKKRRILIHAVSVGEVAAAEPLARELLRMGSDIELVLTTGNNDGMNAAQRLQTPYPAIVHTQLLPWDERMMLSSWIQRLNPDMVLILETELWPNLIRECNRLKISVCIINGRVYLGDVFRYRMVRRFLQHVFSRVEWIGAQSERERERFIAIGAGSHQIEIMGNIKFDASLPRRSEPEKIDNLLKDIPMLLVGGSTHHPEERWLLQSFVELKKNVSGLRLVVAPRHVRRAGSVENLVRRFGLQPTQWSASDKNPNNWDVLILDEIGWLPVLYAHAAIVVIGGSFVNHGGHNPLEAAAQERAIIVGPYVHHFESIVEEFDRANAVVCLKSHHDLTSTLRSLLNDQNKRIELGKNACNVLESRRRIAENYAHILVKKMEARALVSGDDRTRIPSTQAKSDVSS